MRPRRPAPIPRFMLIVLVGAPALLAGCDAGGPADASIAATPTAIAEDASEEAYLTAGVRPDLRGTCVSQRDDLPPRAVAGIVCEGADPVPERLGVYLMASVDDLMATYVEGLAAEGMGLNWGLCFDGAGEANYQPAPVDAAGRFRSACFLNDDGFATFWATYPEELVYVTVVGRGGDVAALDRWAWEGNEDTPGSPTVWRAP